MGQRFSEFLPPKTKWLPAEMPDMTGKVAIVTGGNTGIGKVTCKYLLLKNCTVYLFCRSAAKAQAAISELKAQTGKKAHFIPFDLADLHSIKSAASVFLEKEQRLDVLFNNAGFMHVPIAEVTKQGYDMAFGCMVLGHAYLTFLLLPLLTSTAKSFGSARVVTLSSNGHLDAPKGGIDYSTLKEGPVRLKKLNGWTAYMQAKWGDVVFAKELARRYGAERIVSTSLNPGVIAAELARHLTVVPIFARLIAFPADPLGAVTQLYAGTAPEAASLNGVVFHPLGEAGPARADTDDLALGKALWEWLEEQVKDV
ncbi:NADP-binding protein [Dacryopinax primogenitus]|uniref:NADP-binding protein n=1 Tax=Dacryopinax primogenitus (strain DJM 731) TaxID=1858805 RepID=M5FV33_DACPD|nr:NADP-binding protein [Dacryopinax primogenitus]EJU00114.1 NADP-binding protein [Dacryopinax primogenitus]